MHISAPHTTRIKLLTAFVNTGTKMNNFKKTAIVLALITLTSGSAFSKSHSIISVVTQTASTTGSTDAYGATTELGTVDFAHYTNDILGLTSTVTLHDHGSGHHGVGKNQVRISLNNNSSELWSAKLWSVEVASATKQTLTDTFDIADNPDELTSLNDALKNIHWLPNTNISMSMQTSPIAYAGWTLTTANDSFTVTSGISIGSPTIDPAPPVPEPETYAMLLAGLGVMGFIARRRGIQ